MLDLWISWMIWLIREVDRILIRLSLMVMGPPGWGIWLCWTPRYIYIHVCTYLRGFCNFQFIIFFCPNFDILLRIKGRTVLFVRFDQLLKRKKPCIPSLLQNTNAWLMIRRFITNCLIRLNETLFYKHTICNMYQ